jgi:hypothetical protein
MYHSDVDNASAAKAAMVYLQNSMYKDKLAGAGLYYAQLVSREKELKALNTPKLGDSLLKADGTPWMVDLQKMAPKLNWDDLAQRPANPLGFWLKTDPWDDRVHMLNAKVYAYMNARDKMPFEVTPIFYKLQRYDIAHVDAPAAPAGTAPAADPTTGTQQGAPDPNTPPPPQPAASDPQAPPPAANTPPTQPATGDQQSPPPDGAPAPPPAAAQPTQAAPTQ